MQFFDFIFLARRWRDDRQPLTGQLDRIAADGVADSERPVWVNVWPEGTIVSEHERARSKAYADKVDIVRRSASVSHTHDRR
jgi:lysocardiolipin and lysophospholipid acyltransferase